MAVRAALADNKTLAPGIGRVVKVQETADMPSAHTAGFRLVALLAELRTLPGQQVLVTGAVRPVTQGAILGNGKMLPQERAALLCMTAITGFVNTAFLQCSRPHRSMRIVTITAHHLAIADRVRR